MVCLSDNPMRKEFLVTLSAKRPLPRPIHSSVAMRAGPLVFVSGFLGVLPETGRLVNRFQDLDKTGASFASGMLAVDGWIDAIGAQFWQAVQNVKAALESEGSSLANVVLFNFYTMQMHHHHLVNAMRSKAFEPANTPANTGMQPAGLPSNAQLLATAIGFVPEGTKWKRSIIKESAVSQAMSSYDLGVQIGPFLFTGDFVPGSKKLQRAIMTFDDVPELPAALRPTGLMRRSQEETVRAQAWFLFENLRDVMKENGGKLEDIYKLNVFLTDMGDAAAFQEVYQVFFGNLRPLVMLATASKLGRGQFRVCVEVCAILSSQLPDASYKPRYLESSAKVLDISPAGVVVGPYIHLGNCATRVPRPTPAATSHAIPEMGVGPESDGVTLAAAPLMAEAWEALQNADKLLRQAGSSLSDVVKLVVYLLSMDDVSAVDRVLRHAFKEKPPAVVVIQVPEMPVRGARVEFEIIAYKK
jgi:enamine deaminase RidA (YjgF/YER057c/UK114 family)